MHTRRHTHACTHTVYIKSSDTETSLLDFAHIVRQELEQVGIAKLRKQQWFTSSNPIFKQYTHSVSEQYNEIHFLMKSNWICFNNNIYNVFKHAFIFTWPLCNIFHLKTKIHRFFPPEEMMIKIQRNNISREENRGSEENSHAWSWNLTSKTQ